MAGRNDIFLIVDPDWEVPTRSCAGPAPGGQCPMTAEGQTVPCAGRDLVLLNHNLSPRWWRTVAAGETECPVPVLVAGGG